MKLRWLVLGIASVLAGITGERLLACGDKWLVPTRGLRYELTPAARERAALLVYVNPSSAMPALLTKLSVDPALRKAGYRPVSVATAADFDRTLRQGRWDVVLIDLVDGPALNGIGAPGPAPAMVVVAPKSPSIEPALATNQFAKVLKAPTQGRAFVDAIDSALISRRGAPDGAAKAR